MLFYSLNHVSQRFAFLDALNTDGVIHAGDEEKERHDVWAVEVLPDGTMVTGDGGGNLQFWDSAHGSLISSIKQHQADILCLAASPDGMRVFASGVDSQVAVFGRVQTSQGRGQRCQKSAVQFLQLDPRFENDYIAIQVKSARLTGQKSRG